MVTFLASCLIIWTILHEWWSQACWLKDVMLSSSFWKNVWPFISAHTAASCQVLLKLANMCLRWRFSKIVKCIFIIWLLSPFIKGRGPSFEKRLIFFKEGCFVSLVEIVLVVLKMILFKVVNWMYFHYVAIITHWTLVHWFWRIFSQVTIISPSKKSPSNFIPLTQRYFVPSLVELDWTIEKLAWVSF